MTDYREELLIMIENGVITAETAVEMMVRWLTSDEIAEMLDANQLSPRFMEEEE